ncbi:uncharacterized protein LOC133795881 [Humulus lupulus]|uniref:uncharacterized protein LOC133795881 n=1 Tax=Humulus lupulus TaxID=3486 RepID=UPI002B412C9D|nr:uncharacterized protein LOC133795881 [Humulus lupulus]
MCDIKFNGCFFTWNNKQDRQDRVYAKLDRAIANQSWLDSYTTAEVTFFPEGEFDHCPCLLSVYPEIKVAKKPFRFLNLWCEHEEFQLRIAEVWAKEFTGTEMFVVVQKLKAVKSMLKDFNKHIIGDVAVQYHQSLQDLQLIQEKLHKDPLNEMLVAKEVETRQLLKVAAKNYNSFFAQKEKIGWIKEGDDNTKLFHRSIKMKREQSKVYAIRTEQGTWVDDYEKVTEAFVEFYKKLLGGEMVNREKVNKKVVQEGPILSETQRIFLIRPYGEEEVKEAIFSIPDGKAPGPDGSNSAFFKQTWSVVGEDVTKAILSFLNSGALLKEINVTTLTLVPKVKCPNLVVDFRPIACCNVLYKAATKMICTRLRLVLPSIISQNQGGFIHGRFIAHNIMVCQDLVRHYGRKNCKPSCMIKMDLKKAYDTIDWDFIEEMLVALGFSTEFVKLIMVCIQTPKFSVLFNGSLHGFFRSRRGLRQGDPLSPLIFVLGMEYLSRILAKVAKKPEFTFQHRCLELKLTHLCFADD